MNINLNDIVEGALFTEIKRLNDKKSIVMDPETEKLYYKKILEVYSIPVFEFLKKNSHKNLPSIKVFWEEDEKLVVIEELIQGETLDKYLDDNKEMSFEERKRILLEICDGLEFLHSAVPPVIHRDIKASNIMISDQGSVIIVDYDAAKQYITSKNKDTVLIGTVGSAAPEQYGFGQSDERTDIYALGKLIGRVLPDGRHVRAVVEKATKMDPAMRYSSVRELKKELEKLWDPAISDSEHRRMVIRQNAGTKKFKVGLALVMIAIFAAAGTLAFKQYIYPEYFVRRPVYDRGVREMEAGNYEEAKKAFLEYPDYKDSASLADDCERHIQDAKIRGVAESSIEAYKNDRTSENAAAALKNLQALRDKGLDDGVMFDDFMKLLENDADQLAAKKETKSFFEAKELYATMGKYGYAEADDKVLEATYLKAEADFKDGNYSAALTGFKSISGYKDADERWNECQYKYAESLIYKEEYEKAVEAFEKLGNYSDSKDRINDVKYNYCESKKQNPDVTSRTYVEELVEAGYPGADEMYNAIFGWHVQARVWVSKERPSELNVDGKLTGGHAGDKTNVKMIATLDDGTTFTKTFEGRNNANSSAMKCYPSYSGGSLAGHSVHVEFYDGSGRLIGVVDQDL